MVIFHSYVSLPQGIYILLVKPLFLLVNTRKNINLWRFFYTTDMSIYIYISGWFGTWILFSHILGMSWSQLTNSYFSEGLKPRNQRWTKGYPIHLYLVGLEHEFYFCIYWECHDPNWRTHIFQRGRYTTNQIGYESKLKTRSQMLVHFCDLDPMTWVCQRWNLKGFQHRFPSWDTSW